MSAVPLPPVRAGFLRDLRDVARLGFADLVRDREDLGDVFAMDFGAIRPVVLRRPEHLRHVLVARADDYPKGRSVDTFRLIVGDGLFTADGAAWKAHRALLQPHFRRAAVERYTPAMGDAIAAFRTRWEGLVGTELDVVREMMELALDVVGRAMFSVPIAGGDIDLAHHYKEALRLVTVRDLEPSFPMWLPTPANRALKRHVAQVDAYCARAMAARRAEGVGRRDLLDALLTAAAEGGLDDRQVRDELATLLIAGHETSALTLAWVFHLLADAPDEESALLEELASLPDGAPAEAIVRLPRLRATIDEALRLYPPVWVNPRTAAVDDELGGFRIRRGEVVLLATYFTHRDPRLWPEPDRFQPARFLAREPDRFEFCPFGGGGRTCAGLAFAYQEIALALAALLPHFTLERLGPSHPPLVSLGTLQPRDGLPMRLRRRQPALT